MKFLIRSDTAKKYAQEVSKVEAFWRNIDPDKDFQARFLSILAGTARLNAGIKVIVF